MNLKELLSRPVGDAAPGSESDDQAPAHAPAAGCRCDDCRAIHQLRDEGGPPLPPIVVWQELGDWIEGRVPEIWESRGGEIMRLEVTGCSEGLQGKAAGELYAVKPGTVANIGKGDVDLERLGEHHVGKLLHVQFVTWQTAEGSRRQYRKFAVVEKREPASPPRSQPSRPKRRDRALEPGA